MTTIDLSTIASETELEAAFRAAYAEAPSPLQVHPRTPAVAKVMHTNGKNTKNWMRAARTAGYRFFVDKGNDAIVYSLEPLGATYYPLY